MKKSNLYMVLLIISSSLTACSSTDGCYSGNCDQFYKNYSREIIEREEKLKRTTRINTLRLRENQLGGAAVRQGAYVHVLAQEGCCEGKTPLQSDRQNKYLNQNIGGYNLDYADLISVLGEWDTSRCLGNQHNKKLAEGIKNKDNQSITIVNSDINLGRWERYCNKGKHMNENDWHFVQENNYQIPEEFETYCSRPDYTYDEYLAAWESFCNADNKTTKKYMKIVKETVRPHKLLKHCRLLNNLERTYKK